MPLKCPDQSRHSEARVSAQPWLSASAASLGTAEQARVFQAINCGGCDGTPGFLALRAILPCAVVEARPLTRIKKKHGVSERFAGCHTIEVGGYLVEGHVPASIIDKLLAEKPRIKGISLPGMPDGSPGMSGTKTAPFTVYDIGSGKVFAVE